MTIEPEHIDMINADIDGEIASDDRTKLDALLADNDDARSMHTELSALCSTIDSTDAEAPPPHLRHVIMNSVKPTPQKTESPGILELLFSSPVLKYASTFAAGVLLTLSVVNSNQAANQAFDDVTGLVGTMAAPVHGDLVSSVAVDNAQVAGQVSMRSAGSMLILDFDLVATNQVEIEADYADKTIWFNGFAQLESSGTTVSAKSGLVTLGMEGKRRYAVFLQNGGERGVTINLRFKAGGEVVHEASLKYEPAR
jgi:anti-sigma factor RsiW